MQVDGSNVEDLVASNSKANWIPLASPPPSKHVVQGSGSAASSCLSCVIIYSSSRCSSPSSLELSWCISWATPHTLLHRHPQPSSAVHSGVDGDQTVGERSQPSSHLCDNRKALETTREKEISSNPFLISALIRTLISGVYHDWSVVMRLAVPECQTGRWNNSSKYSCY